MFSGSVVGYLRIGLSIPVYLLLTPMILNALGEERFGLWSFNTAIVGVLNLTDFGLKNSLVYHVARHREDRQAIISHFSVAALSYFIFIVLVSIPVLICNKSIVESLLQVPAYLFEEAQFLLAVTVLAFGIRIMAVPYQAVLEGFQELSRSQSVFLLWLFANTILICFALLIRPDIYGLGVANLISNVVAFIGVYVLSTRHLEFLRFDPTWLKAETLASMLRYGAGVQLATIAIALREPIYKAILARNYDLSTVAAFEVAFRLCTQMASVVTTPFLGVLGVSALLSQRHNDLAQILRPLFIYGMAVLLPVSLIVYTCSNSLFSIWLGDRGALAAQLFPGFFLGFAMYYMTEVLYKAIEGSGRSWYSGTLQAVVLMIQVSLLLGLTTSKPSIVESLVIGFALFSTMNLLAFNYYYKQIKVINLNLFILMASPTVIFLVAFFFIPDMSRRTGFISYLAVHALVFIGLFNTIKRV